MSHPEKPSNKKRPTKITVDQAAKHTEYKRAVKLLEHKGFEFAEPESQQSDLFQAVALALRAPSVAWSKALFARCHKTLKTWYETRQFPKMFDYLAEIRPFTEFYACFPNYVIFEGISLSLIADALDCQVVVYSLMGDNGLLMNTHFNITGKHRIDLFVAKVDDFTFYYPLRSRKEKSMSGLPKVDFESFDDPLPTLTVMKSIDEFLAEFDFNLIQFVNTFSIFKFRYLGGFSEEIRLKLIAIDLKSRLQGVSTSSEAGKHMSRRFTFYDIAKLENLDLESKLTLLFGKKIGDEKDPENPVVASFVNLPSTEDLGKKAKKEHQTPDTRNVRNKSDKHQTEVFFSAEKGESVQLNRDDFLLHEKVPAIPGAGGLHRYSGTVKVFFEEDKYGFFNCPEYGQDVYVALDDLKKAGVTKKTLRKNRSQKYTFMIHEYQRKNKTARKAVEIKMEDAN